MPKVSILMLNWNTSDHTMECLKSFQNHSYKDFEIVLVDNGSEKADWEKLRREVPKVKVKVVLKRLEKNRGITGGMDFAYRFAGGDYIVFMNNDMVVVRSFLSELVAPFKRHKDAGAVVPKVKFWDGGPTDEVQFSGGKLTFYGTLINKEMERHGRRFYDRESKVDAATAACFLVKREVLDELGEVFPPFYLVYFEDIDLSWRIRSAGKEIVYAPKSLVYHKGGISVGKNAARNQRFITRNKYLTFWRNLKPLDFAAVFPFLVGFDVAKSLSQISKGRLSHVRFSLVGFLEFLGSTGKVKAPRRGSLSDLSWEFEGAGSLRSSWSKR